MTISTNNLIIREVAAEALLDLCRICVPADQQYDPAYIYGMVLKKSWAAGMLQRWGRLAKMAYIDSEPIGFIQYEPVPEERIVLIHCIYIPQEQHLHKGIAKNLLQELINDMQNPIGGFDNELARFLVTRTFPGQAGEHYPARDFFLSRGFKQIGDNPDELYFPITPGDTYNRPAPQQSGKQAITGIHGSVLIINEPSFCPYTYIFLKKAENEIKKIAPDVSIDWINRFDHPQDVFEREGATRIIVNGTQIDTPVHDLDKFRQEVRQALAREIPE